MRTETRDGVLFLQGAVTMSTVTDVQHHRFCQAVSAPAIHTLDLAKVSQADSACMSLLLVAIRVKKNQHHLLHFSHMPAGLRMLMSLYEIDAWIKT